jgi:hypothetical protein
MKRSPLLFDMYVEYAVHRVLRQFGQYQESAPASTLPDDQAGASGYDDLALNFDWLQSLQLQDELAGMHLGGAPPPWTQEGAGTQPGGSQLAGVSSGPQPGASQLPGASGAAQQSLKGSQLSSASGGPQQSPGGSQLLGASGGQPGSSHYVAGSTAAVETPQTTGDARRRQIHPPDPLTYCNAHIFSS